MITLHLGVIDQPYTSWDGGRKAANPKRRGKANASTKKVRPSVTTAMVARWLEDRYHVMEIFYEVDGGVQAALRESLEKAMESTLMGLPVGANPFLRGTTEIQKRFKQFISNRTMETLGYPGVPTRAALMGTDTRLKKRRGNRRPSFRDSGMYMASFMAWVD